MRLTASLIDGVDRAIKPAIVGRNRKKPQLLCHSAGPKQNVDSRDTAAAAAAAECGGKEGKGAGGGSGRDANAGRRRD